MPKSAVELRREKLRNRQKQAVETKDQKGLGRKSVLDWSRFVGTRPPGFTPTVGKELNLVDFLPFVITQEWYKKLKTFSGLTTNLEVGDWDYKLELPVHKNVGENNDTFLCPRLAFGERCPRCEDMFEEYSKAEPDDKVIKPLKPSWRCWYNIYDYSEENNPDGAFGIWEDASYYCFEKEILNEADGGEETILFSDIEIGKSIEIKGKEKKLEKNTFTEAGNIEFKDRDPYPEDIVNDTVSFDALVKICTYEEFREAHLGLNEEEKEGGDKEVEPEKEKATGTRRGRQKPKETEPEDVPSIQEWEEGDGCPNDEMIFGDPGDNDLCKACPEKTFDACTAMADKQAMAEEMKNDMEKEEPKKEEASAPTGRRRRQTG